MMQQRNIKSVDILMNKGVAYISASCLTEIGLFLVAPPYFRVEWKSLSNDPKFELLQNAFDNFKVNVPVPSVIDGYLKVQQDAFQIKNLEIFYKEASMCHILLDLDKEIYEIVPDIYLEESDSHYGIKKGVEEISMNSSPEAIIGSVTLSVSLFKD